MTEAEVTKGSACTTVVRRYVALLRTWPCVCPDQTACTLEGSTVPPVAHLSPEGFTKQTMKSRCNQCQVYIDVVVRNGPGAARGTQRVRGWGGRWSQPDHLLPLVERAEKWRAERLLSADWVLSTLTDIVIFTQHGKETIIDYFLLAFQHRFDKQ